MYRDETLSCLISSGPLQFVSREIPPLSFAHTPDQAPIISIDNPSQYHHLAPKLLQQSIRALKKKQLRLDSPGCPASGLQMDGRSLLETIHDTGKSIISNCLTP